MSDSVTRRNRVLDVAKFMAMLTIVFIHVWSNSPHQRYAYIAPLDNFLTTFVLPLFVMVSGILSRGFIFAGDVRKLANRIVGCVWPILTMLVFFGGIVNATVHGKMVVPPMGWVRHILTVGWFFFCLSICTGLTFVMHRFFSARKPWFGLVLSAIFVALWVVPVGMCHAKDMIVYFWFGLYAYPAFLKLKHCREIGWVLLVCSVSVCMILPDFREIGLLIHDAVMPLGSFTWTGCGLALAKYALGLSSALGVLELIRFLTSWLRDASWLAQLGTQTMGVFFIHIQLLSVYFAMGGWTGWGLAGRFLLACSAFLIAHVLAILTRKNPVVSAIIWNPLALLRKV